MADWVDDMPEERFTVGDDVVTTKDAGGGHWVPEAREHVQWGMRGVVTSVHNSHGLCYRVLHSDKEGTEATYDPDELRRP